MSEFLHFFPNEGFRPARYLNDFIGPRMDCPLIVKAEDEVYLAKFDPYGPLAGYAWGTWLPNGPGEAIGKAQTAGTGGAATQTAESHNWLPATIFPWPSVPPVPTYPCRCITTPPDLPPVAPVPVPASAGLLLLGLCIIASFKRRKK